MKEVSWAEANRRKFPEPVVLVVSSDSKGKPNMMPAGWSMNTSGRPPMLAISIGHTRYTHELIIDTGDFVLVFPSEKMKDLIRYTGSCSGRNTDKFAEFGIGALKSKHVIPPLIEDSASCFECRVKGKMTTGDHTIFAGEVVASYISENYKDRLYNFRREYKTIPIS